MKLTIDRNQLSHALQTVQKAVPVRSTIPILTGIKIDANIDGLVLTATDLEIGIELTIPSHIDAEQIATVYETGSIVLVARYFSDIVRKLAHSQLELTTTENDSTLVQSGHTEFSLHSLSADDYPKLPAVLSSDSFSIPADVFTKMIEQTTFAAAKEEIKAALTGVCLNLHDGVLQMVSTDGQRLSKRSALVEAPDHLHLNNVIVPAKSLTELSRMLPVDDQLIEVMFSNHQMLVTLPNGKFYSRLVEGNYPETARLIPTAFKTIVEINTNELASALDRVALIARDTDNVCRFQIKQDVIEIASSSINIGKVSEIVTPKSVSGENMLIGFKVNNMIEALRIIDEEIVRLEFTSLTTPFLINPVGESQFTHLIMPYRIS